MTNKKKSTQDPNRPNFTPGQHKQIIAAVLVELDQFSLSVRPAVACGHTLRTHLEHTLLDSIGDDQSPEAVCELLGRMQTAALGKMCKLSGVALADYEAVLDEQAVATEH